MIPQGDNRRYQAGRGYPLEFQKIKRRRMENETIKALKRAREEIRREINELKAENTRARYVCNFEHTHELSEIEGKISGLLYILRELEKV
jgi:cell shape-determining protein MreC